MRERENRGTQRQTSEDDGARIRSMLGPWTHEASQWFTSTTYMGGWDLMPLD